jgi:hypothetical protein
MRSDRKESLLPARGVQNDRWHREFSEDVDTLPAASSEPPSAARILH